MVLFSSTEYIGECLLVFATIFTRYSVGLPLNLTQNVDNNSISLLAGSSYVVQDASQNEKQRSDFDSSRYNSPVQQPANSLVTLMRRSSRFREPWEVNHNICPPSLCTTSYERGTEPQLEYQTVWILMRHRVTWRLIWIQTVCNADSKPAALLAGFVFYNGDIVLDPDSKKIIYKNTIRQRWRRKRAMSRKSRLWPDGVVPYVFGDIAHKSKQVIEKAMKTIEASTCVRFRQKKLQDEDYIRYISEQGCWSIVGRVGGEQKLSIGEGDCQRIGTAIHEIAHSLGFWHEQNRPDRDQYVQIIPDNISPRYLPDFEKEDKDLVTSRGYPYDYESVMHYSKTAFYKRYGDITIKVIGIGKTLNMTIGQRDELSVIDIAQLRDMYKCHDKWDNNMIHCPDKWVRKDRSCYKFEPKLKEQFAGAQRHCEKMNSRLLSIETSWENKFIKTYVKRKFPHVTVWRTGGKVKNGMFQWYKGKDSYDDMDYTDWNKGHPSTYSSMAMVFNKTTGKVKWQGVWLGSASQLPDHSYAAICERRAKRRCITGQHKDGRDYRGKLDHTIDGILCQKWTSQYPHSHKLLAPGYKNSGTENADGMGDHNYCRNPLKDRKSRPWCFTNKKHLKWQYCDVTICSGRAVNVNPKNKNSSRNRNSKKGSKKDRYSNKVEADNKRDRSNKDGNTKKSEDRNRIPNDETTSFSRNKSTGSSIRSDRNGTNRNKTERNRRRRNGNRSGQRSKKQRKKAKRSGKGRRDRV